MFEAFNARSHLSPSDRGVFDTKLIQGAFSAADLLSQLSTQIELARAGNRSSQSLKQAIIICSVIAALTCVVGFILEPVWLLAPASMIALAITLALVRRRLRRFELPPQIPATAFPFLTVLKHDLAPTEPLRVRLDLSAPTEANKRKQVGAPYSYKAYYEVVDTTYVDPWFEGEARLADGSQLSWNLTDEVRVSERSKRKTRGRVKTKICYYKTSHIEISVSFPTKLYRVEEVPPVSGQKVSMKQNEKRCSLTIKRVAKRKSLDPLRTRQLLDTIAVAFRAAKPVRGAA